MSDVECVNCSIETSYADAMIADLESSCNNGEKHEWREL